MGKRERRTDHSNHKTVIQGIIQKDQYFQNAEKLDIPGQLDNGCHDVSFPVFFHHQVFYMATGDRDPSVYYDHYGNARYGLAAPLLYAPGLPIQSPHLALSYPEPGHQDCS
jgi:hypothetical protein